MPEKRSTTNRSLRILKIIGWSALSLIVVLNLIILISGKFHLYRAIQNTIFKGRTQPSIHEYHIFHNRYIEANNPHEWKTHPDYASNDLDDKDLKKFNSIATESYLIIKNDSLYFEKYWPEYYNSNKDSISNSFSVAKSVVSILIGIAMEEGKIQSLDQPIGDFVKSYNKGDKKEITLRHLMTMSSGLNWDESSSPFSDNVEAYYGWDLEETMDNQSIIEEPGKYFDYMSGNTQLLGFALTKATGMSLADYTEEKLWGPLNATHTALWNLETKDGYEKAFCCLYATPRDFARIGQLYLNKGNWRGRQIISERYVQESLRPANIIDKETKEPIDKYGLSWWLTDYNELDVFYARGILGQYIICIPAYDLVIVRTGYERGEKLDSDHPTDLYWYIDAALKMIGK